MSEGSDAITLCGICAKPEEGAMVQCDDCDRWFHFDCAKVLPGVEHNDWVCSECASNTTTVNIGTQENGDTDKTAEHQIADFASSVAQGISVNPGKYNSVDTSGVELELSLLEEERQANLIFLQKKYNILQRYHDASHKDAKESFSVPNKIAHTSTNATIANTQEFFPRKASSTFTFGGAQTNKVVERNKESAQGNTNVFQLGRGTQVSFENEYFRQGHGDRGLSGFHDGLGTGGRCEGYQQGGVVGEVMQPSSLILKPEQLQARHTVPKELPTFSGRPEEWPIFISSYENSTRICGFSNDENLLRLQRALKGKAFEYVCNQLLIPSLVPEVISTLRMVFGRPEYIINGLLEQIRSSPGVNANKLDTLVHFSLQVKNLTATMEAAELLSHINNPILLQDLINKLSPQLRLDWALFSKRINGPNLMDFSQWLYDLGQAASSVSNMPLNLSQQDEKRKAHRVGFHEENPISEATMVKANLKEVRKCSVCAQDHFITICSQFKAMTYNDKWNVVHRMKLCRSCLKPHNPKFCKERKNCGVDRCTMKHHFLLHKPEVNKGTTSEQIIVAVHHMKTSNVLYRVLPITIYSQQAAVNVFALLDDGSGPTIIEQTIVQQLQLKGEESELCLRWTDGSTRVEKKSALVNLQVSAMGKNKKFTLSDVRTVNKLDLPPQSLMMQELSKKYSHLKGLPVQSYENAVPQIIIGLNNKHVAMPMKFREGKIDEPAATKTRLGWTVYGVLESVHRRSPHNLQLHICECDNDIALQKLMIENMTLESAGMNDKTREQENSSYNEKLENVIKRTGNHFTTKLLWRSNNISLPDNFGQAMSRLICFEKKLNNDQDLKTRVNALVQSMEDKKYIRKLSAQECKEQFKRKWYLPIFSVNNPNKPNKTRVVWDAAASYNGVSLNSCLEKGPDLLRPLLYVLFNFRIGRIGICGDICDMFHRVSVFEEDQHSQRFLWRNGEMDRAPDTYVLQVLSFGASCSPSIAQYVRNKNAQDFAEEFPRAAKSITERHYVDDMLDSADTEQEAIQLVKDVIEVHKRGNFFIRGWLSNSAQVTDAVGDTCVEETFCNAGKLVDHVVEPDKVLGLWWQTSNDVFTFNTKFTKASNEILCHEKIPTKRELLRLLMSIFDPLGFLAFYTIRVRILLQSIWRSGIEWDDPIPAEFVNAWKQWLSLFRRVSEVQVPRCYFDNIRRKDCKIELHLFVDASESACAAVAYFRIENANNVHIALVSSKTKVAPLRPVSIPRMELIAAVLGSRLAKAITTGHDLKIHDSHYYTDSKTVLTWLRSDPRKYKQFVMFRIAEVQENTDITKWQYIQSKQNVADAATKWKSTNEFGPASSWFSGPEFLLLPKEQRPKHEMPADVDYEQDCETKLEPHFVAVQVEVCSIVDTSRFSKWERLERCMAYVKRFIDNCKKSIRKNEQIDSVIEKSTNLTADDLLWSQHFLYHLAQAEAYKNEIEKLKENSQYRLPKTSPLKKLSPFIDEFGILRLRGRLENAPIQDSTKNPIILPKRHHITHLVVNWYHRKFRHVHHDTVVNEIFQMFHISSLRRILRSVRKNCQHCKLRSANPTPPEMGQLPEARLSPYTRPFTHVGIDFFGPFLVTFGRRTEKRYGVLFTCMTCRAIHLEIAHSLTMNSCVMAIRNFISRRGTPTQIFSDNGTNLVAAEKELREAHRQLDFNTLQAQFVTAHTKWTFIPPASPHMGGAWERLIRSVKNVLYQIVTPETKLSDEKLYNLFLEIESIVNSRPLTYLSLDTAEHEALTPNHFLLGSSNGKPSLGEFCAKDQYVRSSWRHSQFLAEKFWKRWVTEILPTLTRRTKWHDKTKAIEKGDVVVIVDPNLPRYSWPKGIITSTYPGKDGQVRSVTVRTATGEYHRPSTKIAVLDVKSKSTTTPL